MNDRRTGRTTDALRRLVDFCEATGKTAVYVTNGHNGALHCLGILEDMGCKVSRIRLTALTPLANAVISVRSLASIELSPDTIRGMWCVLEDHVLSEDKDLKRRASKIPELSVRRLQDDDLRGVVGAPERLP